MIALAIAIGLAAAPGQPAAPPASERRNFTACLSKFMHDKLGDKLDAVGYKTAAKAACATEEAAFRKAWVSFELAMRTKPSEAEQNAVAQASEAVDTSAENYLEAVKPKG
jgi:hypothetical protein